VPPPLSQVVADRAQRGAAAARTRRWRRMHDALARQLSWQWPPRRPLAFEGFHLDDDSSRCGVSEFSLCLRLCRILFQVSELKLKLLQDGAALRRLPELCVAQLCDRELQLLDLQRVGLCFVLRRGSTRFRRDRSPLRGGHRFALRRDGSARSRKRGRERKSYALQIEKLKFTIAK